MKPHKHAELIKRWADGAEIQYRAVPDYGEWIDARSNNFIWDNNAEYRIKPEVKKTVVRWKWAYKNSFGRWIEVEQFYAEHELDPTEFVRLEYTRQEFPE